MRHFLKHLCLIALAIGVPLRAADAGTNRVEISQVQTGLSLDDPSLFVRPLISDVSVDGMHNDIQLHQIGSGHEAHLTVVGSDCHVLIEQTSVGAFASVHQAGTGNSLVLFQGH
ncbi:hypothetical protein [Donghicola sp. XS_ASV15]|uniref:hypothetical protein n=1 Tax=Donghicola sp. XS_ASV15 TaxID=3241295 RepID=UPI003514BD31